MDERQTLKQWIDESQNIVFFGGAGVSTESGIPDFRSVDGLYHQHYTHPPEQILSHAFFMEHTEEFFRFYRAKMLPLDAKPNITHKVLAQWEAQGKLSAVVTQNIDGLHQQAGSKKVYELHGSIHRNYCMDCRAFYTAEQMAQSEGIPRCTVCGGIMKPDVVLYGEYLNDEVWSGAEEALMEADMVIVGGTSLSVYPASMLVTQYEGDRLVLINKTRTDADWVAQIVLHTSLGEVFGELVGESYGGV